MGVTKKKIPNSYYQNNFNIETCKRLQLLKQAVFALSTELKETQKILLEIVEDI